MCKIVLKWEIFTNKNTWWKSLDTKCFITNGMENETFLAKKNSRNTAQKWMKLQIKFITKCLMKNEMESGPKEMIALPLK